MVKIVQLDQRSGEEVAVAEFKGPDAGERAEAELRRLQDQAEADGKEFLRYWMDREG
jgi:hypothetical protein